MKLLIENKEYNVKVAETSDELQRGLKRVKELPKGSGLVLKFTEPTVAQITMVDVRFPLDLVFIKDLTVQAVKTVLPNEVAISIGEPSDYVLEVNAKDAKGVTAGNKVTFVGEKSKEGTIQKADGGVLQSGPMQVLDENGVAQANLEGDERIFSRQHTAKLIELAELASKSQADSDYKKLGTAMLRYIDKQDTQEQEYVKN